MFTQTGGQNKKEVVGGYDPTDGYFHLGSQVFTTKEVREALAEVSTPRDTLASCHKDKWWLKLGVLRIGSNGMNCSLAFGYCRRIRAILVDGYSFLTPTSVEQMFRGCDALREIIGVIDVSLITNSYWMFLDCTALEEVRLRGIKVEFQLTGAKNLSLESIRYAVENANSEGSAVLRLHASAYARITPEIFALAESKNITLATT